MILLLIIMLTTLKAQWVQEGDYEKLSNHLENIRKSRISIDKQNLVIYNENQIQYVDLNSGTISKDFLINDENYNLEHYFNGEQPSSNGSIKHFELSIDEELIVYTYQPLYAVSSFELDIGYYAFNINDKSLFLRNIREAGQPDIYTGTCRGDYLINKNRSSFKKYSKYYQERNADGGRSYSSNHFSFNIRGSEVKVIEDIYADLKFEIHTNDILYNRYESSTKSFSFMRFGNIPFYKDVIDNLTYNFLNDSLNIFYVSTVKENEFYKIVVIDCKTNEETEFYTDFKLIYNKRLYDNIFVGVNDKKEIVHYNLDNNEFRILNKFNTFQGKELTNILYDNENNMEYFIEKNSIQRKKLNINTNKLISQFYSDSTVSINDSIQFFNTSIGEYDELTWDFGDNTTSTEQYPFKKYSKPGLYIIKLIIKNKDFTAYSSKFIRVHDKIKPDFEYSIENNEKPFYVNLKNLSETQNSSIFNSKWFINNKIISSEKEIDSIFNHYGIYEIKLVVEDLYSKDSIEKNLVLFPKEFIRNSDLLHKVDRFEYKFYKDDNNFYVYSNRLGNNNFLARTHFYDFSSKENIKLNIFIREKHIDENKNNLQHLDRFYEGNYSYTDIFINKNIYFIENTVLKQFTFFEYSQGDYKEETGRNHGIIYISVYENNLLNKIYNFENGYNYNSGLYPYRFYEAFNLNNNEIIEFHYNSKKIIKYEIDSNSKIRKNIIEYNDLNNVLKGINNYSYSTSNVFLDYVNEKLLFKTKDYIETKYNILDLERDSVNNYLTPTREISFDLAYENKLYIEYNDIDSITIYDLESNNIPINSIKYNLDLLNSFIVEDNYIYLFGSHEGKLAYEIINIENLNSNIVLKEIEGEVHEAIKYKNKIYFSFTIPDDTTKKYISSFDFVNISNVKSIYSKDYVIEDGKIYFEYIIDEFKIFDLNGKLIFKNQANINFIDLMNLKSGSYLIMVKSNNIYSTIKIII